MTNNQAKHEMTGQIYLTRVERSPRKALPHPYMEMVAAICNFTLRYPRATTACTMTKPLCAPRKNNSLHCSWACRLQQGTLECEVIMIRQPLVTNGVYGRPKFWPVATVLLQTSRTIYCAQGECFNSKVHMGEDSRFKKQQVDGWFTSSVKLVPWIHDNYYKNGVNIAHVVVKIQKQNSIETMCTIHGISNEIHVVSKKNMNRTKQPTT